MKNKIDYKTFFESAPGMFIMLSTDFKVIAATNDYVAVTLKKREDIIGNNLFDIFPNNPNDPKADGVSNIRASLDYVLKNKVEHKMPLQKYDIQGPNGKFKVKYWLPSNKPVLNSKKQVEYIIHSVEDVTEIILLKNKEKNIIKKNKLSLKSVEKYQDLEYKVVIQNMLLDDVFKNISDYKYALDESSIVAVTDKFGVIQYVNDNFCKISKFQKEELLGKDHRIINSGYHSKNFFKDLWKTIKSGKVWKGEIKNKTKDGSFYWVDTAIVPFLNEDNKPFKYLAIRKDITEQKLAIEDLRTKNEQLQNLFENSVVSIYTTDIISKKPISVNQFGAELFGYKSIKDYLKNFSGEKHVVNLNDLKKINETIITKGVIKNMVIEMKKVDGTFFWAEIFMKLNSDSKTIQAFALDITGLKLNQEQLETKVKERTLELTASIEREKELGEMKSRFVSMASHEFRTPLGAILTSAELIYAYSKNEKEEKIKKHTDRIVSSVNNLTLILNEFLSIDKLEHGKIALQIKKIDLKPFSEKIIEEVNLFLKDGQKINFNYSGKKTIINDGNILRIIFLNLLSNAIKFSDESKEVYFSIEVRDNYVSVKVKDEGIGIPKEDIKNLFGLFYRAKNVTNIQGTGLGLNIVKKYIELMKGTINVTSKINNGTTFTLQFPNKIISSSSKF